MGNDDSIFAILDRLGLAFAKLVVDESISAGKLNKRIIKVRDCAELAIQELNDVEGVTGNSKSADAGKDADSPAD